MFPDYPPTLLRGIPNKGSQFFDSLGHVTGYVFRPYDGQEPIDGFYKISINWEDVGALDFTLHEPKPDGSIHYKGGVARVSLEKIDSMQREAPWAGTVEYCREPKEGNDYHGNLLLNEDRVNNNIAKIAFYKRLQLNIIDVIPPIE